MLDSFAYLFCGRCTDPKDEECDCMVYRPTTFSVSYDARSCAIVKNRLLKLAGDL